LAILVADGAVAVVGGFGVNREAPGAVGFVAADAGTADMPAATNAATEVAATAATARLNRI
jgi:hypothetical protein